MRSRRRRCSLLSTGVVVAWTATAVCAADDVASQIARLGRDRPADVRVEAARWFGRSADAEALQGTAALAAACRDPDPRMRKAAVAGLGLMLARHERSCPLALVEAMFDSDEGVRTNASGVVPLLWDALPPEAVPALVAQAGHRDPGVRSDVLLTLAHCAGDDPKIRALLRQATHDRDLLVRNNAVAALWAATEDLAVVVPHWLLILDAPLPQGSDDRDGLLKHLMSVAIAERLREQGLERPDDLVRALVPLLADESPIVRGAAARVLGATSELTPSARRATIRHDARRAVRRLLDDPNERVRGNAAVALERLP